MFLLLSSDGNELRVLDTDDMVIDYMSVNKVIEALKQGVEFANVHDNFAFLEYLRIPLNHKISSVHVSGLDYLSGTRNPMHCIFGVASGMQFKQSFLVTNKKLDFGCKYTKGIGLEIVHKGVASDLRMCLFSGFIYNLKQYRMDLGFEMDTADYIGYDTRYRRLELVYTDLTGIDRVEVKSRVVFTENGLKYDNSESGNCGEIESAVKGVTLTDFKRKILMG